MKALQISSKLSRSSRRRRWPYALGVIIILVVVLVAVGPLIVRSDNELIQNQIAHIQELPLEKRIQPLEKLRWASRADRRVMQALAQIYAQQGLHEKAAQTYAAAQPALQEQAMGEYQKAIAYKSLEKLTRSSINKKPTAVALAYQALSRLDQGRVDEGCASARDAINLDGSNPVAIQGQKACDALKHGEAAPLTLYNLDLPLSAKALADKKSSKTTSELNLLAAIAMRQNDPSSAINSLSQAFSQSPFDRDTLAAIGSACSTKPTPASCNGLLSAAAKNTSLLPPY